MVTEAQQEWLHKRGIKPPAAIDDSVFVADAAGVDEQESDENIDLIGQVAELRGLLHQRERVIRECNIALGRDEYETSGLVQAVAAYKTRADKLYDPQTDDVKVALVEALGEFAGRNETFVMDIKQVVKELRYTKSELELMDEAFEPLFNLLVRRSKLEKQEE